jgi:hypothetical protein
MTRPQNGRSPVSPTGVLVCFHAHPDDEVFTAGGVLRLAAGGLAAAGGSGACSLPVRAGGRVAGAG